METALVNQTLLIQCKQLYNKLVDISAKMYIASLPEPNWDKIKDNTAVLLELNGVLAMGAIEKAMELLGLSMTCDLTGLPNRTALSQRTKQYSTVEEVKEDSLLVLSFDISGLKIVNDTGKGRHKDGDTLIKAAGRAISTQVRKKDIYHVSGDEFIVILHNCPKEVAERKKESISAALKNLWQHEHEEQTGVAAENIGIHAGFANPSDPEVLQLAKIMGKDWQSKNGGTQPDERQQANLLIEATKVVADERMMEEKGGDKERGSFAQQALKQAMASGDERAVIDIVLRYHKKVENQQKQEQQQATKKPDETVAIIIPPPVVVSEKNN
jgi:diguanylate cyclase (GGDEF)-like protein